MKFAIVFASLIAATCAFQAAKFPLARKEKYEKPIPADLKIQFWDGYLVTNTPYVYTLHDVANLCIAFYDSAAGEIDDIFPDVSYKLALYQAVNLFFIPKKFGPNQGYKNEGDHAKDVAIVPAAYAAMTAWAVNDVQAHAAVEILLTLTNRAFHHYIDADNDFLTALNAPAKAALAKSHINAPGDAASSIARAATLFTLSYARSAVKTCYRPFREEIVEGTDAIIYCEAFAYSTRGFPLEKGEEKHDAVKKAFFKSMMPQIKAEAQKDIKEFIEESLTGIKGFRDCIISEAKALDYGYAVVINGVAKNAITVPTTPATSELDEYEIPLHQELPTFSGTELKFTPPQMIPAPAA